MAYDPDTRTRLIFDGHLYERDDTDGASVGAPPAGCPADAAAALCLALYKRVGEASFSQLNGSFLLIVYDETRHHVMVVTDRFCSRPVYYHLGEDALIFSTQVKGVVLPELRPRLDLSGVFQFFSLQSVLEERTFLEGIHAMPPAGVLRFPGDGQAVRRYWQLSYQDPSDLPVRRHADELAQALTDAIRRQTRGTPNLGLLLSGGLDSRAIVAAATEPMVGVTIADHENREVRIARQIADQRKLPFVLIERPADYYPDLVDVGVEIGDGMHRFDHAHFAGIRGHVPAHLGVLVTGYAFDYLLKGANLPKSAMRFLGWPVNRHALLRPPAHDIAGLILSTHPESLWRTGDVPRVFRVDLREALVDSVRAALERVAGVAADLAPTPAQRYEYVFLNMMARGFRAFTNVLSIRHYFEDRTVAFDNDVLEQHRRIPPRLRLNGTAYRLALKRLDRRIFHIPDANTGFRPGTPWLVGHLGDRGAAALHKLGLARRPAVGNPVFTDGSWPNMAELIRHNPKMSARIMETINDKDSISPDLFDVQHLNDLMTQHMTRQRDASGTLFLVLTFGVWFKKCGL